MTSKSILVLVAAAATSVAAINAAYAETYQWKDSTGQTVISDTPPPSNAKSRRAIGAPQPSVVSEKPAEKPADDAKAPESPKTTAEKDLEFKRRQQEAKDKADKQAKEAAADAEKKDNCERAKRNLTALENNQPMVTLDDKGQRKFMDTTQREQELERARRFIAESCK
ncbi:DUF4124 domain-containing protein [Dechloromonas sp. XY25]|uniref:DUF4124 domain-containing protein n=1 Tax=Dechloromonas hankyongensis TaxID=2908002 RepID=A0ABS9K3P3_9RHOO|nr:DUF4124 domain-containing protein [Dechloromonas hankyongensis]MCG2577689.1 DUF4124 domain-containing protein [Dechloromonas hankyongensis]